jgi:hypothetical protein
MDATFFRDDEGHHYASVGDPAVGVAVLEAWIHEGAALGVITIHSRAPQYDGHRPDHHCPLYGTCYTDVAPWAEGFQAAEFLLGNRFQQAVPIVARAYRRLASEGARS